MNDYEASLYDALLALETRDESERFLWDVLSEVLRQGAGGCQLLFERVKGKNRGQKITESERSTVSGANRWRGF